MLRRLGYVGISLSIQATPNRGLILRRVTPERLRELIRANLEGLRTILEFNVQHGILLFRISSRVIPFGGHPANQVAWADEFGPQLSELGAYIRQYDMRVSMHPGQYTLLSSPEQQITNAAIRDLAWQARFLDALGLDPTHKLVIHVGGGYGDKATALKRWADRYRWLPPSIRRRLVVENDERVYSSMDVLSLSAETGVPIVFDVLHHRFNPGTPERPLSDVLEACFATWRPGDGPPKVHFSSQAPDKRAGGHADYIEPDEFLAFLGQAPEQPFDCMLEAKAKDLALFRLREALAAGGFRIEQSAA